MIPSLASSSFGNERDIILVAGFIVEFISPGDSGLIGVFSTWRQAILTDWLRTFLLK
jgi:hypothetical protein